MQLKVVFYLCTIKLKLKQRDDINDRLHTKNNRWLSLADIADLVEQLTVRSDALRAHQLSMLLSVAGEEARAAANYPP